MIMKQSRTIPSFYFPLGRPTSHTHKEHHQRKILTIVKHLYGDNVCLTELEFFPITKACDLPRYMNLAFYRKIIAMQHHSLDNPNALHDDDDDDNDHGITYPQFVAAWTTLSANCYDDDALFFSILQNHGRAHLIPEDFFAVLEDLVFNHPGLQFLTNNTMFQERYIETVICRIFYEASCASGKMSLRQFQKSLFSTRIKTLGNNVELNNTQDYFSYKHFYVLYCKFWTLDNDHDLMLTAEDLFQYNEQALNPRVIERLVSYGQIQAFSRNRTQKQQLTYLDYIWFLLHEVDKTSPKAIEYWFRMLDEDGDGVLSGYELEMYWQEQMDKQKLMFHEFEEITFDDILRQMCDLIQPATYGQFTLMDLKKNGFFAERFLDTFLHLEKFTLHECIQGCVRLKLQEGNYDTTYLCGWDRYTEMEYQQLIAMDQIAMASGVKDDEEEESDSAPGTPTSDASMSQDKDEEPEHVDWKLSWLAKSQALQDAS